MLNWTPETGNWNDEGGEAAQTGNLVHAGAAGFHQNGNQVDKGAVALELARAKFPKGDVAKARKMYEAYVADKENQVTVPYVEHPVTMTLEPDFDDPLGLPVVVTGTLDQIRQDRDGYLSVWDIKTGSRMEIKETLDYHKFQLSAYAVAASQTLGKIVHPGGIIYTAGYLKPRARTRIFAPWDYRQALNDMRWVRRIVTEVRKGNLMLSPGEACKYCPFKSVENCTPRYKELTNG